MRRLLRAAKLLARDGRIPRPLRWLAVIGLLPVPGPFDEVVLALVAALLVVFLPAGAARRVGATERRPT